jgi:flagellar motor switch/type III secretory pathway protein FliN
MSAARVLGYPWHALASTTRADARTAHGLRHAIEDAVRLDAFADAIGALAQTRVEAIFRHTGEPVSGDGVGALFARADDPLSMYLVEVEPALAAALCARVMKRNAPVLVDSARRVSEAVAGAFGAILLAAARRAHAEIALTLRGAGPARPLAAWLGYDVATATFTVLLGDDAYIARAALPRPHAIRAGVARWDAVRLASLGEVPLALRVVAAATLSTVAEVAALSVGDAWMPGDWALGAPRRLAGPVTLAGATADEGLRAILEGDGRLVLSGERVVLAMDDQNRNVNEAIGQALGDVPVVVRVEIGTAEMRAREWASVGTGDVIALGARIADPVILRIGGVEVARGELVDIEGEVGVRILSRTQAK